MKRIKISLVAVALLGTVAAFASKSGDTYSYKDASGNSITQGQFDACPGGSELCGQQIDDQTQQVVAVANQDL